MSFDPERPALGEPRVEEDEKSGARELSRVQNTQALVLSELVNEHLDFVWRSLRRFGVREADVDDATQRVFLIANEKLANIDRGRERSFLVGIAVRIASHARRACRRRDVAELRLSSTPPPPNPNPEELTERLEARQLLDRVLEQMPEDLRAVFVLFELEELSVDDIARSLVLPRGTVATRLRRAREVFQQSARAIAREGHLRG